ncbi:MAG: hypothetical protein WC928_00275 [Patescibacteria group bacterium]|jgi:hypothetical protein
MSAEKNRKSKIWGAFNLCLITLFILGGLYFLKSMDDVMIKNIELEQLKADLNLLQEEKAEMELKKNTLESYENISARLDKLNMVKIASVDYINIGEDSLAKK